MEHTGRNEQRKRLLEVTQKKQKADTVFKNGKIVNVFTGEILEEDVAVKDGIIAGIGKYEGSEEIDLQGAYLLPGLIDGHLHVESSMALPSVLSPLLLKHGVTSAIIDPHEIVNAAGKAGMDYMLKDAKEAELDYYFMVPSSVPSCDFEVIGADRFEAEDMADYLDNPRVLGLAETMRFEDVMNQEARMQKKMDLFAGKRIDGHMPGLSKEKLQALHICGVQNDHEAASYQGALNRLRNGIHLLIREGSQARNLEDLLPGLLENGISLEGCSYCTDDKHLEDIVAEGTIDWCLQKAAKLGTPMLENIRMATLNTARHYGLSQKGAIAPGYDADFAVVKDLESFEVLQTYKYGKKTDVSFQKAAAANPESLRDRVHLPDVSKDDFLASFHMQDALSCVPGQLFTRRITPDEDTIEDLLDEKGHLKNGWNFLWALERYGKTGEHAGTLLKGFGIKNGALAASYAHDSHNVIAAGDNLDDLVKAIRTLQAIQGGFVLVQSGQEPITVPLPAAGLMSDQPADALCQSIESMKAELEKMEMPEGIDPFGTLTFLSLPVIGEARLTPQGLFDVNSQTFLSRAKTGTDQQKPANRNEE